AVALSMDKHLRVASAGTTRNLLQSHHDCHTVSKTRTAGSAVSTRYDAIIVGGGIGGSALAAVLARAGKQILLLEQSEVYEERVRGEWIAPWGVKEVRRVNL